MNVTFRFSVLGKHLCALDITIEIPADQCACQNPVDGLLRRANRKWFQAVMK